MKIEQNPLALRSGDRVRGQSRGKPKFDFPIGVETRQLTFAVFQRAAIDRARTAFVEQTADWTLGDWGNALAGEVGEACNQIKKLRRGEPSEQITIDIGDELADVITYAAIIAARLDIDLAAAVRLKFNRVSDRVGSRVKL